MNDSDSDDSPSDELIEIEAFVPDVTGYVSQVAPASSQLHESVQAKLLLLENERAVFLNAEDRSWAMVIDLDGASTSPVRRVSIGNVAAGMFILLRTEGGGDYVAPVANLILGSRAEGARSAQRRWKGFLREKVRQLGWARVARVLNESCVVSVTEQDVKRWISDDSIRTRHRQDFLKIMEFVGLESEAGEFWSLMGAIFRAHLRAGKQIQERLLERVRKTNLSQLQRLGSMEFALPGDQGGSLTAFRIEQVVPGTFPTLPGHLSRLFEKGRGDLWRE